MTTNSRAAAGLRIGDLATLTGVTPRAIRHYHAIGLLPEPERDASGYRRYGAADVVRLTRIRRLRALGMATDQIAEHLTTECLAGDEATADLPDALRAIARDVDGQIETLTRLRARLLSFAESNASGDPASALTSELRRHGLLADDAALPESERAAARLVDALHPGGIDAVAAQARPLFTDPAKVARVGATLARVRDLPDDADDETLDTLVADLLELFPRPEIAAPGVDPAAMERLLGNRLSSAQRRLARRFRAAAEAAR